MKNDYLETLRRFLPEEVFESSQASCREKRKSVSFRKEKNDSVHYFAINACQDWPEGEMSCDGLFVCSQKGREDFLVLLVELKGHDTRKALKQIEATADTLCFKSQKLLTLLGHGKAGRILREKRQYHHRRSVLGVVASRSGGNAASTWQSERKRLRAKSIHIIDKTSAEMVFTVTELYENQATLQQLMKKV